MDRLIPAIDRLLALKDLKESDRLRYDKLKQSGEVQRAWNKLRDAREAVK
jgi:hypothetical protein